MARMARVMTRLGLEVNAKKTRMAGLPEESFDFLGYTVGRFHRKDGRPYIGTRPSRKSVKSLLGRIHQRTTRQWYADDPYRQQSQIMCRRLISVGNEISFDANTIMLIPLYRRGEVDVGCQELLPEAWASKCSSSPRQVVRGLGPPSGE